MTETWGESSHEMLNGLEALKRIPGARVFHEILILSPLSPDRT